MMVKTITILTFGAVTDITGSKSFVIQDVDSTEKLVEILEEKYPLLKTIQYAIAVNKEVIQQHTILENDITVAILPPFSGG